MNKEPERRCNHKGRKIKDLIKSELMRELYLKDTIPSSVKKNVIKRCRDFLGNIHYFSICDRLMTLAKKMVTNYESVGRDLPNGTILISEELTHAKGRLNRSWFAPKGGLYACIAISPRVLQEYINFYSLIAGIGVCEALRELNFDARIRWINDVLIRNRKVCGVLTEVFESQTHHQTYVLLGLGVNVNIKTFPPELTNATSLCLEYGMDVPFLFTSSIILSKVIYNISLFEELHNLDPLSREGQEYMIEKWLALTDTINRFVNYGHDVENHPEILGAIAIGIDDMCGLILRDKSGQELTVYSGEIRYVDG